VFVSGNMETQGGRNRVEELLKRGMDLILALVGLVLGSPLMLVIALAIKRGSPGPVFYRGVRVGRYGKPFRMFKFRTMHSDADKIGGLSTSNDDPRITPVGRFLRKHKLDELPQLINIVKGEMSFVGPRPEVPFYVNMFTRKEQAILSVRPGITDWASLWNPDEGSVLAGSPDPEKAYMEKIRPEKIRLQLEYVRRRSLATDIAILFQTIRVVLFKTRSGAMNPVDKEK
jgi:lipopolysaccharide/colanic/teichoic acid biosynthesis glycosyltransferase